MRKQIILSKKLAVGDSFSFFDKPQVHLIKKLDRRIIAGLTIIKIYVENASMPYSLTQGTHVLKVTNY